MRESYIVDAIFIPVRSALSPVEGSERGAAEPRGGGSIDMTERNSRSFVGMASSLAGTSDRQTNAAGWANFAPCFTCGKDSRAGVHSSHALSHALSHAGIGVLRFDFCRNRNLTVAHTE